LPRRARVIKATMVREGVTALLGAPNDDQRWVESGRGIEQMTFTRPGEPEFSVLLEDGYVVDVAAGRPTPADITPMLLPEPVPDATVGRELAIGLSQTQAAPLLGAAEWTSRFTFKGQPVEYATYHQRDGNGSVTITFMGGVLTAFTFWPLDEL